MPAIDPLADQVDLSSPYNNGLRVDHKGEPPITSSVVDGLTPPPPLYRTSMPVSNPEASNIPGDLEVDDSGQLLLRYLTENGVVKDLTEAFNVFAFESIPKIMSSRPLKLTNKKSGDITSFIFTNPRFTLPMRPSDDGEGSQVLMPRQARQEKRTYAATLEIDIEHQDEFGEMLDNTTSIAIADIPVMLGSGLDHLVEMGYTGDSLLAVGECKFDPFGYFIIRGQEKIILTQNKLRSNRILIYPDADGDIIGMFTSRSIKGQMPIQMYLDTDGTIRFNYSSLGTHKNGGQVMSRKKKNVQGKSVNQINKKMNTINIIQAFRVLGNNDPNFAWVEGQLMTDENGDLIKSNRFDDILKIISYIVSFIDPDWQSKAMMLLQASYLEAIGIADDYVDIYSKSLMKSRAQDSGNKVVGPEDRYLWTTIKEDINHDTVERIFTHIPMDHITPSYIQQEAEQLVVDDPIFAEVENGASSAELRTVMADKGYINQIIDDSMALGVRRRLISLLKNPDMYTNDPETNADNLMNEMLTDEFLYEIELRERTMVVKRKIMLLGLMTARYVEVMIGKRKPDDRDAIGNQRFVTGGKMMEQLFRQIWDEQINNLKKLMTKQGKFTIEWLRGKISANRPSVTNALRFAFSPNNWGPPSKAKQENITEILDRGDSQAAVYSHLLRINAPTNRRVKNSTVRSVKPSQMGYIDAVETPSGQAVGLVNNKAIACWISVHTNDGPVWNVIEEDIYPNRNSKVDRTSIALINGVPSGWCNAEDVRHLLVIARRNGEIPFDTSLVIEENALNIYTDGGRPTKPVLIMEDGIPLIAKKREVMENGKIVVRDMWGADFQVLLNNGLVEYQDQWELKMHGSLAYSIYQVSFIREDLIRNRNLLIQLEQDFNNLMKDILSLEPPTGITDKDINRTANELLSGNLDLENPQSVTIATWLRETDEISNSLSRIGKIRLNIKRMEVKQYTHMEMDPTAILGIMSSTLPKADRNPGPRNAFQCGMEKQAFAMNYSNPSHRFPTTGRYLSYPSRPILATQMQKMLGLDDMPFGETVVMAILTMPDNEEDGIVFKKEFLERGGFRYTLTHSTNVILTKKTYPRKHMNVTIRDDITKPIKALPGHRISDYHALDERGLPVPDSVVKQGDCLLCIVRRTIGISRALVEDENGRMVEKDQVDVVQKDISVYVKKGEGGIVDKVLVAETGDGDLSVTIRVRNTGIPQIGDKVATRQAQKSVISRIVPEADLPFTEDGMRPDVFLNPHSLPKRMTMGTLIEILVSKYGALAGERVNGTIFRPFELDSFRELLNTLYGYNMNGTEIMRNPINGETFPSQIMIGPIYYQLLKHQVEKKAQVRGGTGPVTITGQAVKGKKRGGGIQFGEGEKDAVLAYGAAHFARERLFTSSDPYTGAYCQDCDKMTMIDVVEELATCSTCSGNRLGSIFIPKTFGVLTQHISAIGVDMRIYRRKPEEKFEPLVRRTQYIQRPEIINQKRSIPVHRRPVVNDYDSTSESGYLRTEDFDPQPITETEDETEDLFETEEEDEHESKREHREEDEDLFMFDDENVELEWEDEFNDSEYSDDDEDLLLGLM
jgi:DNA-directed RNA polymerase II subunit RPB2